MTRRTTALLCALGLLILLTACGGTTPVSSDVPDVSNESSEFAPDSTTTTVPPTTTTTTAAPTTTTTAPLTAEEKLDLQIKKDFLALQQAEGFLKDITFDKIHIEKKHGIWNDALVLSIPSGNHTDQMRYYEIAGLRFLAGVTSMYNCYLYKNRKFESIRGAYESGWITEEDVRKIVETVFPYVEWESNCYDEEKVFCTATIEDEFEEGVVLLTLKKNVSEINRVILPEFFEPYLSVSEIAAVEDLMRIDNPDDAFINKDEFHQILKIEIHAKGKEAVLEAVKKLEQHPAVLSAGPNGVMYLD